MTFVLDPSVALTWAFADERSPATLAIKAELAQGTAVVPVIWPFELTNGIALGERRGRLSPDDAQQFLTDLLSTAIFLDSTSPLTLPLPLLALARSFGLTAYDAAYLELAYRLHLPLATVDERLTWQPCWHGSWA